ncbi:MAG: DUF1573 domain-containing protein [Candidatus Aureabacteria bacterium]|nr:DUF1573 domain-containing protein [Candidatus Auribacterota bacterium]
MKRIIVVIQACLAVSLISPGNIIAMGRRPAAPPPQLKKAPLPRVVEPAAPERTAVPAGEQPKIVFEEKEHDFGKLMGADKVEHVFKFRNEGKGDLKIDKVNTSCGCTAALLSANVVPPRGNGEIKTTFTVGDRQGQQTKHIYVLSNDPNEPRATLTLKGLIIPPVGIEPSRVSLQAKDTPSVSTVKISQTTEEELKLGEVTASLNLVNTQIKEEAPENGKKRYSLEISLKPDIEPGQYFENVTIATNCATKPKIEIPVRITVRGDIEAAPSRINLGSLSTGQEISRTITLSNTKGQSFKVERVEVENKDFAIRPEPSSTPSPSHTFTLTGKPSAPSGRMKTTIVFHLDHPKQKKVVVTAYGDIRQEKNPVPAQEGRRKNPSEGALTQPGASKVTPLPSPPPQNP